MKNRLFYLTVFIISGALICGIIFAARVFAARNNQENTLKSIYVAIYAYREHYKTEPDNFHFLKSDFEMGEKFIKVNWGNYKSFDQVISMEFASGNLILKDNVNKIKISDYKFVRYE